METLESLFNSKAEEKLSSPLARLDYKKEEYFRFRLTMELPQMKLIVRHFVDKLGYVNCGQKPTKVTQNGEEKFDLKGDCVFCNERKAMKKSYGSSPTKQQNAELADYHRRTFDLISSAEVEIHDKEGNVVKPIEAKAIKFKAADFFFPQFPQHYSTLSEILKRKKSLTKNWFTMGGKGGIVLDDPVSKEDLNKTIEVDLTFFDKQTRSYEEGSAEYLKRTQVAEEATEAAYEPVSDEDESIPF